MRLRKIKLMQLAAAMLLSLGCVSDLSAQNPDTMSPAILMRKAEQENWFVRASTPDRAAVGRIAEIRRDTAVIGGNAVAMTDVMRIERRLTSGGGWKSGAVVGGAAAAAWASYAFLFSCDYNCSPLPAAAIVGISALIGGLTGQLISPPQHSWREEWPQHRQNKEQR